MEMVVLGLKTQVAGLPGPNASHPDYNGEHLRDPVPEAFWTELIYSPQRPCVINNHYPHLQRGELEHREVK